MGSAATLGWPHIGLGSDSVRGCNGCRTHCTRHRPRDGILDDLELRTHRQRSDNKRGDKDLRTTRL